MKYVLAALLAVLTWPALAQPVAILNGQTPIIGGSTGQCVTRGSNGLVNLTTCGGAPSGAAGGVLSGTYPNPGFAPAPAFTGLTTFGSIVSILPTALSQPAALVVTAVGGSGFSYRYQAIARSAGFSAASVTMPSPVSGPNPNSLSASVYLRIAIPQVPGVNGWDIFRSSSNAPFTPGYIGHALATDTEFRDIGIIANSASSAPTSDTGSAGLNTVGPIVIESSALNAFGLFQVGNEPVLWEAGDTPGWGFPNAVFTQKKGPYQTATAVDGQEIVMRSPIGSLMNPVGDPAGAGLIGGENYVTGAIGKWKSTAYWEFGGAGGTMDNMFAARGRHQFAVQDGNFAGMNASGRGLVVVSAVGYTGAMNTVTTLLTNGTDMRQYRVGYQNTRDPDSTTTYQRADFSFRGVNNILTALTWSGGQLTATTTTAHGIVVGQGFELVGNTPSLYNGAYVALSGTTGSTLVATLANNPGVNTVLGSAHYPGTVYYAGPVAANMSLLPMTLTGSYVSFDQSILAVNTLTTWANNQTCAAGQMTWDANFIYVCTSTNTVKRAILVAF